MKNPKITRYSKLDLESAGAWHDAEHAEKIHEFSLHLPQLAHSNQLA